MPIFESKGLLEGKRLRKLTDFGHVLWPFIFSQASERYARLEIDPELILQKLGHLAPLLDQERFESPIGYNPDRSLPILVKILDEYCDRLAFRYTVKGVEWMAFDKPNGNRVDFARHEDNDAPAPPEPAYTEWLKGIHHEDWADFHPGEMEAKTSAARAEAGRAGGKASGEARRSKTEANRSKVDESLDDVHLPSESKQTNPGSWLPGSRLTGNSEEGEKQPHRTVQNSGRISPSEKKTRKPETVEPSQSVKQQAIEIVENVWDIYKELPQSNDDVTHIGKLLIVHPHLTMEEIDGVVVWMLYVNNDQYWLKRTHSSADFVRSFHKMHEQYEKCGGLKVAKAAEQLALTKAAVAAQSEEIETFRVQDVDDDAEGLS